MKRFITLTRNSDSNLMFVKVEDISVIFRDEDDDCTVIQGANDLDKCVDEEPEEIIKLIEEAS